MAASNPASNAFSTNGQQFTSAAQVAKYFKTRFAQGDLENHFAFGTPTVNAFGAFKQDLTGEKTIMPILLGTPQGIGASLQAAIRNATSSKVDSWVLTTGGLYGHISIDAKSMYASRDQMGAYLSLKEQEWKLSLANGGQQMEKELWGTGDGTEALLTVDPGVTAAWTVSTSQIVNMEIGMKFLVYADSSGVPGTVRAGGPYTVTGIDYLAGTFSTDIVSNTVTAVGDHIVRDGSVPVSGVNQLMVGVPAWIPTSNPTATLFFGVDRSAFPQLLGGWRGAWKGSIEETVKTLHAQMSRLMQPDVSLWLSAANYNRFDLELGARAIRQADGGNAKAGFAGVSVTSAGKVIKLRTSPYIPDGFAWLLDDSTWELHSLGPVPHVVQDDGQTFYRQRGANDEAFAKDAIAAEWRAWPQLVCRRPFANGCVPIQ